MRSPSHAPAAWHALALRIGLAVVAAVAWGLLGAVGVAPAARARVHLRQLGPSAPAAAPARLLVSTREWRLELSRLQVRAGAVSLQVVNQGEDVHSLALRRVARDGRPGGSTLQTATIASGGLAQAGAVLTPGRWRMWCPLPGHDRQGMHAVLVVVR